MSRVIRLNDSSGVLPMRSRIEVPSAAGFCGVFSAIKLMQVPEHARDKNDGLQQRSRNLMHPRIWHESPWLVRDRWFRERWFGRPETRSIAGAFLRAGRSA